MDLQSRILILLAKVAYKTWHFRVGCIGDVAYLQVAFHAPDNFTGEDSIQLGRRWLIEPEATDGEILRTAFKAVMTAEEHEAREQFTFKGKAVFGPHFKLR